MISSTYSKQFHKNGGFDRSKKCQITGSDKENESGDKKPRPDPVKSECCGNGIQRAPFKKRWKNM